MSNLKDFESESQGFSLPLPVLLDSLKFDQRGLIPAIAQQHDTGEVLMMAWMNRESLVESIRTRQVCYWSRSRQKLWRKGETSGHRQRLVDVLTDCDGDALLLQVDQTGPACHTERRSCFYWQIDEQRGEIIGDPAQASQAQISQAQAGPGKKKPA